MSDSSPIIEVIGDGEPTDAAVTALARLLLAISQSDESRQDAEEEAA